jgi:hypothetical protein
MSKFIVIIIKLAALLIAVAGLTLFGYSVVGATRYLLDFNDASGFTAADYILMIMLSGFACKTGTYILEQIAKVEQLFKASKQ